MVVVTSFLCVRVCLHLCSAASALPVRLFRLVFEVCEVWGSLVAISGVSPLQAAALDEARASAARRTVQHTYARAGGGGAQQVQDSPSHKANRQLTALWRWFPGPPYNIKYVLPVLGGRPPTPRASFYLVL